MSGPGWKTATETIKVTYWACLACERQNEHYLDYCRGCGRSKAIATDHSIWDKYPPRQYLTVDAVIVAPDNHNDEGPCICDDPCEVEGHDWQAEDIADGVVGGGAAHVTAIYCSRCDAEGEPEDLE